MAVEAMEAGGGGAGGAKRLCRIAEAQKSNTSSSRNECLIVGEGAAYNCTTTTMKKKKTDMVHCAYLGLEDYSLIEMALTPW